MNQALDLDVLTANKVVWMLGESRNIDRKNAIKAFKQSGCKNWIGNLTGEFAALFSATTDFPDWAD